MTSVPGIEALTLDGSYTGGEGAVVLEKDGKTLVIIGKSAAETKAIYDTLAAKVG